MNDEEAAIPSSYCEICRVKFRKNVSHCGDCGVCIEEIDHHCPWTGKCVAKNNLCTFYIFLLMTIIYFISIFGASALKW